MKRRVGNMFKEVPNDRMQLLFVTGNSTIKRDGGVVMGRGAAKQLRDWIPGIDKALGKKIREAGAQDYNLVLVNYKPLDRLFGLIQVKHFFGDEAELDLIKTSMSRLKQLALQAPNMQFNCNYPGIGNGHLTFEDVSEVIDDLSLPDNVILWTTY